MSCEEGEMRSSRRRLPCSPSAAAAPMDDDDLLSEILLRLPPLPSSLPRASAVCKRWRGLASDAAFSRRFRRHHRRNLPLLGFFHQDDHGISFFPTLEAPNRVPPGRFSLQLQLDSYFRFLGCRHGLVLIFDRKPLQFLVWDPVTGQQNRLAVPPGFDPTKPNVSGAVLRSAAAAGDVQHFKVVLVMGEDRRKPNRRWLACVYSSQSGVWGNPISRPPYSIFGAFTSPAVLIGDSLYWEITGNQISILEFDLERESLSVIPRYDDLFNCTVMRAEGGGLGFLGVSGFTAQLWKRNTDSDGVGSWGIQTTIELDKLLSLDPDPDSEEEFIEINGFAEDNNLLLLSIGVNLFTVQLDSLQFKKLPKPEMQYRYQPFESVYAAGRYLEWYSGC